VGGLFDAVTVSKHFSGSACDLDPEGGGGGGRGGGVRGWSLSRTR
jgi:hypothetical protein